MVLVAIDTCFGACSVAAASGGRILAGAYEERRTGHAEAIVPMIDQVLAAGGIAPHAIKTIAVTRGPGTFAGMRIGLSAAQGLQLATGAVLIPLSSLWAIGQRVLAQRGAGGRPLAIAVDAGRGQVYFELLDAGGRPVEGPELLMVEEAERRAGRAGAVIAGSGARLLANSEASWASGVVEPEASAFALAALDCPVATEVVTPLYFRPADAVVQVPPPGLR
jgi:tRNA threonylcarbamoyladenosine biosynthesis protein TsaB